MASAYNALYFPFSILKRPDTCQVFARFSLLLGVPATKNYELNALLYRVPIAWAATKKLMPAQLAEAVMREIA